MIKEIKEDFIDSSSLIRLFFRGRRAWLPMYLWVIWIIISVFLFTGAFKLNIVDVSKMSTSSFFGVSISALSFTFALFNISKGSFNEEELIKLYEYKEKNKKGNLLDEFLTPFIFTSFILTILSLAALLAPYITIDLNKNLEITLKIFYLLLFILGIFSLFNITCMSVEDVYYKIVRKSEEKIEKTETDIEK